MAGFFRWGGRVISSRAAYGTEVPGYANAWDDDSGILLWLAYKRRCQEADEDDYTGFPKIVMYFTGDEVFAGIAPDYEKSFIRCGAKDYEIKIKPSVPHAWPLFAFLSEGREGEREIIADINAFFYSDHEKPKGSDRQ